uniref:SECIS binding protein 2 n=1 Tax=Neogobius melanostomus TaxID=47308 RepID=A0A8C6UM20_9GOBI
MPESVTFEVKMDEFPELTGIFVDQVQRHSWGLSTPNLEEDSESRWKSNRNASTNYEPPKVAVIPSFCENALAYEGNSASATSSWANIASQPPKKPVLREISKPSQVDEVIPQEGEVDTGKKKRKKKKKAKGTDDDAATELKKHNLNQDPPRFEDEDEFPGLTPCFSWAEKSTRSKTANLCNNESQTQSFQLQPIGQKKDTPHSAQSPCLEAPKAQKVEKVSGKKSKVPVQLDIGNMLAVLEKKQSQKAKLDTKPLTLLVGGGLPVVPKQQPAQKKSWMQDKVAHNPLDSTSPLVKKGKQREVPKAKKPTALKKIILKEREERKQRRLLEEKGLLLECDSTPATDTAEEDNGNAADSTLIPAEELDKAEINEDIGQNEETAEKLSTSTLVSPVVLPKIHSRKFREYCTQMLSKDVDECVTTLLKELVRFQDRLYQKDPMKARMKRRIVMGLREVLKHLKLRKVKCVIISPNCERIQSKGGLDEALHAVIDACREQEVPFVFALSRKALGRCVNKAVPVSLVGIFNFDGAQDIYHKMIELSSEARNVYEAMLLSPELTASDREMDMEQPFKTDQTDPVSDQTQSEEPEYIKLWKKLLEKESSHIFPTFEEELSSMCLDSECTEHSDDGGVS